MLEYCIGLGLGLGLGCYDNEDRSWFGPLFDYINLSYYRKFDVMARTPVIFG